MRENETKTAKKLDIREFVDHGYLQEANRLFFHPLGLALEVDVDTYGFCRLGSIWDCRDDPEGIVFDAEVLSSTEAHDKADRVTGEWIEKSKVRFSKFGFVTQPMPMGEE